MGNASPLPFAFNWSDDQKLLYKLQAISSNSCLISFSAALTHYFITEWIWARRKNNTITRPRVGPLNCIVSIIIGWVLWTLLFNYGVTRSTSILGNYHDNYSIFEKYAAAPILGLFGWTLNLALTWIWVYCSKRQDDDEVVAIDHGNEEADPFFATPPLLKDESVPIVHQSTEYYITYIKIFLTNMVILYHCAEEVQGLDYTYTSWGSIALHCFKTINESKLENYTPQNNYIVKCVH